MRNKRQLAPGAKYRIILRSPLDTLRSNPDFIRDLLAKTLWDAQDLYYFRWKRLVIFSDSVHFIIQPQGETELWIIMRWVLGVFTQRFNRTVKGWGPFWAGRYKSEIYELS